MILSWAIAATIVAVLLTCFLIAYRRQVKKTCRQLAFLKTHQTNLRLTSEVDIPEMHQLIDNINEILDQFRAMQTVTQKNQQQLKETITSLSHDIRTPLTSLDGYFQLLSESDNETEKQHYIQVIQSRIASLSGTLEELFTYTKLQNDAYVLPLEQVDFVKCVYDTVFSFYDAIGEKGITPEIDFEEGHVLIQGNSEALRRIIQNIIQNAIRHGNQLLQMKLYTTEQSITFSCINGVAHPEEINMNQIFNQFYKADSARSKSSTGLGLSIAKELTERMEGTLTAKLEGNLFSLELQFPINLQKT